VLITDYSSIMFDFAVLDRPIVIYAPDWYDYRNACGVYFDLLDEAPGLVARSAGELVAIIISKSYESGESAAARARFRERFCPHDDGEAAAHVVRSVFPARPS
jgi:CDP-glycerol glycerophosphotransferase